MVSGLVSDGFLWFPSGFPQVSDGFLWVSQCFPHVCWSVAVSLYPHRGFRWFPVWFPTVSCVS